jgi:hypothetical protein
VGKRRKVLGLGAAGVVVAAVVVIVIATNGGSSNAGAQGSSAPSGSATVERRDLIATDTESGTLSYADPQTVFNRVSGTITWLPAVGQVIHAGHALYDVDDAPVVLFDGSTPAFRDLSPSVSDGPDVLELNRDLLAMGFAAPGSITPDDVWQAGTTTAVERWQASLGETETGTITLGQIVFLPGPQRITALDTVVGSTGSGSGGGNGSGNGNGSASGAGTSVTPRPEFVSLTTTTPTSVAGASGPGPPSGKHHEKKKRDPEAALLKAMAALLKAEQAQLKAARAGNSASGGHSPGPGKSGGGGGGSGGSGSGSGSGASGGSGAGGGASATAIMSTSSTKLIVTVDLDASKQAEAVVGAPVMVELPTGRTVNGKVAAVSPVAQSSSGGNSGNGGGGGGNGGSGSGATIPVTITVPGRLPSRGLDQAAVSVNFEQQVQRNVLSVPVTALLATQGGGYAVQEALAPHRLIPVTPGLFAAGYVQISGAGVYPGLEITDSQG